MFRKAILVLFIFFFPWSAGAAIEGYFCVADISSGFSYNDVSKKWVISSFNVDDAKYMLRPSKNPAFKWEVIKIGDPVSMIVCVEEFNEYGYLNCRGIHEFRFNKKTSRFLMAYLFGYYLLPEQTGIYKGSNNPYIEIGKCSPM